MIKGFRFTNQLSNAEVDARIHQEFLNKNDGIFYGMNLSYTNNSITISEGLCEIAGRPVAVIDNETISIGTDSLYCLLILEIDLSKESTKDTFNQVSFKLLTSSTSYPTITQQDINKYNVTDTIYQLEFARFRRGSSGVTEFKDTRKFLNFEGIYNEIKSNCEAIINQIKQELDNVKDGSTYILKSNMSVITGTIENVSGNSEVTKTIAYPEGFDENSAVISLGIGRKDTELNYGQATQDSGAIFNGNPMHYVKLTSNGIVLHAFYNIEGMSTGQELKYKIILLRV